jgi:hypothetical protein
MRGIERSPRSESTKEHTMATKAHEQDADPILTLRTRIATAEAEIETCRQDAMAAALHARDFQHAVRLGIYQPGDPPIEDAERAFSRAIDALKAGQTALRNLEQALEVHEAAAREAAEKAERERRRAWAWAHHPDLVAELEAAQDEEATLLASPYARDSQRGQWDITASRSRIQAAQRALEQVAASATAQGDH